MYQLGDHSIQWYYLPTAVSLCVGVMWVVAALTIDPEVKQKYRTFFIGTFGAIVLVSWIVGYLFNR